MLKEARKMANFLALVVDATTRTMPATHTSTENRCFQKRYYGVVNSAIKSMEGEIYWCCSDCANKRVLSYSEGTRWDNLE